MNRSLVQAGRQQPDPRAVEVLGGELDQLAERGRLGGGHERKRPAGSGLV
jgi:hypothetical protein